MIPFERDSGSQRDPRRGGARGRSGSAIRRAGVDPALLEARNTDTMERSRWIESLASWLVAPLCLGAIATAALLVFRGPDGLFAIAFGVVLALGSVWILVCSLHPARPDRKCPECGAQALTRLDPNSTHGLRCRACSYRDPLASSFLLAEEEGAPLEDLALRERRRRF